MFVAALCVINLAVTGCKDSTTPPKKDPTVAAGDKKEVKVVAITSETKVKKTGDTTIKVELEAEAPEKLTLTAKAKDTKDEVLKGTGEIEKGKKSGEVKIVTKDA